MNRNPFSSRWLRTDDVSRRPHGRLSYVAGPTDEPLRFITIAQLLDEAVAAHGARDAAVFAASGRRWSWYELQKRGDEVAAGLLALGIGRGDRVGIWAPNCEEWLGLQFGTARIGAILVNINPAYREAELEHALNKVQCRVLVMARAHKSSDYVSILRGLAPEIGRELPESKLRCARLPRLRHVVLIGDGPCPAGTMSFRTFRKLAGPAQRARIASLCASLDPDDAINVQFTSGTTGLPKGATLTHYNVVNNARFAAQAMRLTASDRLCIPVPLYHCFGMVLGVLVCVASGATMVFPAPSFDAQSTLRAIAANGCTALHGVPSMFIALLEEPALRSTDVSTLRTGIMAGAPCPVETMRRVVSDLHMPEITIAYGMTETSPVSFQSGIDDPLERRVTTVGRVQPHVEVKIVDEEGRMVPIGKPGELCTRGYLVMRGYWDEPERTREAIDDARWMHSGDLATLDNEGYCNIVGRIKDMLIRGGENVYPREIEEFVAQHPKVQAVQVFGVPDPRLGEEVCAWIVLRSGAMANEEEIRTWCAGRIAHYKVPRYIRLVSEFPATVTGKPQKFAMREAMMRELGVGEARTA
jgi:fatty-acyl-CoA synthase